MLDFSLKFVCATHECSSYKRHIPSPVFRKSFILTENVTSAEILICGLGFYDLYINGKKITKGIIAPYISNPDDIIYYDHYDLAPYLNIGENVIGVICGNGFNNPLTLSWEYNKTKHASSPKLALSFNACGEHSEVSFDASSFKCTESEILFDNMRTGAFVDSRLIQAGRFEPGFDDSNWRPVIPAQQPRGYARICSCEPVIVHNERCASKIFPGHYSDGRELNKEFASLGLTELGQLSFDKGYIYDFTYNDSGIFKLKINGYPGQKIDIFTSEICDNDTLLAGNINRFVPHGYFQHMSYICAGGEEEFEFPFAYIACRYAFVTGITADQATSDLLTYLTAHSALETRAGFECSDADANALYEIADRSDTSNFNFFPTDCPHREKNGWTGDDSVSAEHMILTLGVEKSWREWLNNIRAAQNEAGALPGIVPTAGWGFAWGNGPAWDSVLFNLPWFTYVYRGNTEIILENAHAMMSYLEYISKKRDEKGLIAIGLGDWVPTGGKNAATYPTPLYVTDTIMVYDMAVKAKAMFDAVGLKLNAAYADALAIEVRDAFRRECIDLTSMLVDGSTITGQAIAIYFNILDPGEKKAAFDQMLKMIHAQNDGFIGVGMLGLRTMFHVLADFGEAELAYKLITRREYPSYGCILNRDATTLPEQIEPDGVPCGSLNHHFLGDYKHWYIRQIAGINVNPAHNDANTVMIRPHFINSLNYASGYHILPGGRVDVKWERTGKNEILLNVKKTGDINLHISLTAECVITDGYPMYNGKYPNDNELNIKISLN